MIDPAPPPAKRAAARKRTRKKTAEAVVPSAQPIATLEVTDPPAVEASLRPKIFQIFFEPWQRPLIDPLFVPLDNGGPATEYLEFDLFEQLAGSDQTAGAGLWGALSWRFTEKTGLKGADLLRLIDRNPGFDVYYCNALPQHEALYHNLWAQGETAHPRILELARAFLAAAGLQDETQLLLPSALYSTANYFIGTPAFWSAYVRFVRDAVLRAERSLPADVRRMLHSRAADERGVHGGCTYMPFIVERLFPSFLRSAGSTLTTFKLPLDRPEQDMNVHLRLLREMKDAACRSKSNWLAACWVNYRNLYLSQQHGHEWTRRHLRLITPAEIRFA